MSLEEYHKKRNFGKTKEPKGGIHEAAARRIDRSGKIFVMQKHGASTLHYDLRLEYQGVLKSWAIPKTPPEERGVKRLAIETEDHPIEYAGFEGVIPEGEYGAGTVKIWDRGTYEAEKWESKEIIVNLSGKKLKGRYCLIKFRPKENNWLFFKCG